MPPLLFQIQLVLLWVRFTLYYIFGTYMDKLEGKKGGTCIHFFLTKKLKSYLTLLIILVFHF